MFAIVGIGKFAKFFAMAMLLQPEPPSLDWDGWMVLSEMQRKEEEEEESEGEGGRASLWIKWKLVRNIF